MLKRMEELFGVDLGTCNTLIYQQRRGIVLQEPSVVAIQTDTGEIKAFGQEAYEMIGRTPANVEVIYPLKDGVIANFDMTLAMLKYFIGKIKSGFRWFRSFHVLISVPCGITNVQKRAVEEMIVHKGARRSATVEEPLAAAMGAGLPVEEPIGSMVLDIGGGTSQVAIISLGGIVVSEAIRRGGMSIDQDIIEYVKRTYNIIIGERTAEDIKKTVAAVMMPVKDIQMNIRGRDLMEGLPTSLTISSNEIYDILNDFMQSLLECIRLAMEKCPPELAGDVMEQGILLCGGGALLEGLDKRLQLELGVPVHLAEDPMACIALGTGKMINFNGAIIDRSIKVMEEDRESVQ
ncbi:rod shape-determining protein [Paenibacillus sp. HWE-109]|uniref:rod shape-determining protein n=1 Tax=Paenibacillus sp. HWE-109 TaxID=1306526 RepID=UPI001EE141F5|nr:rod shape-determining protein [Paenibacillus sp. HWE-109]UKS29750.1 rod shape-determining protein [Paenibacillus sp. HWE-109]